MAAPGRQHAGEARDRRGDIIPFLALTGATIGGIYSGLVTPTEAAAVGCVLAMLIAGFCGEFDLVVLRGAEMGEISPPIGINLFLIQSIWSGRLADVVMGTIPFHLIMFVLLALLVLFLEIAMWLPGRLAVMP